MKPKLILLGLGGTLAASLASAGAFVACSSSSPTTTGGPETGTGDVMQQRDMGTSTFDVSLGDNDVPTPEGGGLDVHIRDGGAHDADGGNPTTVDGGKLAACSPITGTCDIVSQNCSSGSECVANEQTAGGPFSTSCQTDQPSERLPIGTACCPGNNNPCLPGLECNNGNLCTDAAAPGPGLPPGWGGSRCSPHCCPSDAGPNTANCGSVEGGALGQCDLTIVDNSDNSLYNLCTYPQICQQFHIIQCQSGFACSVTAANGTEDCTVIFNPNGDAGGLGAGGSCDQGYGCADGLTCIINSGVDAGSTCLWNCYIANQTPPPPFDAGKTKSTVGYGGCPAGQTCGGVTGYPNWLGVCSGT